MRYKRILIIIASLLFFLTAFTFYLNRVIFPRLIKKIAVERIEEALKRKVEIGTIHFNWIRGFIIDKIKIYEGASGGAVFAQADQVSFGVLLFPGFKHFRITIPYINVRSPSVHLIRTGLETWNFSDMLPSPQPPGTAPPQAAPPAAAKTTKAPSLQIAWGGISISNGKFLVDDEYTTPRWSEYFDNINLKLSLSYKGINYEFNADIPRKGGFVGATVHYQPLTQNTEARIRLQNINTASYLSLINIPDFHLNSGFIKSIDLNIHHTQATTSAQGNILMENLDVKRGDESFKGTVDLRGLDVQYQKDSITARGQIAVNNMLASIPGLSAGGSVQAKVSDLELQGQNIVLSCSLHAQDVSVILKDRRGSARQLDIDNLNIKKDADGVHSTGDISTKDLSVKWPGQSLQGDIALKSISLRMKNENDIRLKGTLAADHLSGRLPGVDFSSRQVLLESAQMSILDQKNIALRTGLSVDDMSLAAGKSLVSGSLATHMFLLGLDNGVITASTTMDLTKAKLDLGAHKTIEGDPQMELNLQIPLKRPQQLTYKGSVTLSDGMIRGFAPFPHLDNIELDVDFHNDHATINALNAQILDTNVNVTGTVHDFRKPVLDLTAEADELDLAKIKDLFPKIAGQYGLTIDGTAAVKIKFNGPAGDPSAANILAKASLRNADVSSSKFHQQVKNITGIIEATTDSLAWHAMTADYLGTKYSLSGNLKNFKKPEVSMNVNGPDLQLDVNLEKNNDLVEIHSINGKYLNAGFEGRGTVRLVPDGPPFVNLNTSVTVGLEDLVKDLPGQQKKNILPLNPTGIISLTGNLQGPLLDWKKYRLKASITSPVIRLMGYRMTGVKIDINQADGKIKNATLDGNFYDGDVHAVASLDLRASGMPYELALNIEGSDLHQLKMDSPLKMDEINGKFFLTTLAHGTVADFKDTLSASGTVSIRDGYLAEFNLFKGLLSVLNDALRLGQVMITDVDGNFTIEKQKIMTDDLRLKGPTIVLLTKGWVNFDQMCDLDVTVDLSSGVVPDIAHDVLNSINIRIYDKIADPKFKRRISMPQVINTLIKNFLQ
ncbi:MAG: AsmA family protein [Candidatus Omnitrophica bacterium]|nr:AsmA family protein [Candidatus Omnitrophota bacterium]